MKSQIILIKSPCLYLVIMIIEKIFSLGIEKFIIFHHYPSNFRSGLDLTWARSPPYRRSESGETLNEYSLWRLGPGYSVMTVPPTTLRMSFSFLPFTPVIFRSYQGQYSHIIFISVDLLSFSSSSIVSVSVFASVTRHYRGGSAFSSNLLYFLQCLMVIADSILMASWS